jgi:hypothetical protein
MCWKVQSGRGRGSPPRSTSTQRGRWGTGAASGSLRWLTQSREPLRDSRSRLPAAGEAPAPFDLVRDPGVCSRGAACNVPMIRRRQRQTVVLSIARLAARARQVPGRRLCSMSSRTRWNASGRRIRANEGTEGAMAGVDGRVASPCPPCCLRHPVPVPADRDGSPSWHWRRSSRSPAAWQPRRAPASRAALGARSPAAGIGGEAEYPKPRCEAVLLLLKNPKSGPAAGRSPPQSALPGAPAGGAPLARSPLGPTLMAHAFLGPASLAPAPVDPAPPGRASLACVPL